MKNNYLVDTHCHMNLTDDIDSIIMDAEKNNVLKFIISGCDKKSIRDGLEIIYRYPSVFMTIGFHPDEVDDLTDKDINDLEVLIKTNKKIVGIGEIGLDYYHNDMNKERQKEFFEKQLELAEKHGSKACLLSDLVLVDNLSKTSFFSPYEQHIISSYVVDEKLCEKIDFLADLDFSQTCDFINLKSRCSKIVNDHRKKVAKNEYLEHRTKDLLFINFLKTYHGL